jgi:hypothetical protein
VAERIRHLPITVAASVVSLTLATAIAWLAGGDVAALGVASGVALVTASYVLTTVAVAWADTIAPKLVLPVGLGVYVFKFSLFGVLFLAVTDAEWAGRVPMAVGICVGVVVWTASQAWWTVRAARASLEAFEVSSEASGL